MLREIACAAFVLVAVAGCHSGPSSTITSSSSTSTSAASASPSKPAASTPDQSATFFPPTVETYGLDGHDRFAELYALRQIDPCGFVDSDVLTTGGHADFSYTYSAVHEILTEGVGPIMPLGGNGCTVAFPSGPVGLSISVRPGEVTGVDSQFSADSSGVLKRTSPCSYRVSLPLTKFSGASALMKDPLVEVSLTGIADDQLPAADPALCSLGEAVAAGVASQVSSVGVPVYGAAASRFLTADPCAAAPDLNATGAVWKEPNPQAQWPTTWRHPSVCNLEVPGGTAVVRYGLAVWSDYVVSSPSGKEVVRSSRDEVSLVSVGSDSSCFVVARAADTLSPVVVGAGAPELAAPTPVVAVSLNAPNCGATAEDAAVAALERGV